MSDSIHLYQSVSLSPSTQSAPSSSSHSLLIFPVIPQHTIVSLIHCSGFATLLKTLHSHFWWDALPCCCDSHWRNNTFTFIVYKCT